MASHQNARLDLPDLTHKISSVLQSETDRHRRAFLLVLAMSSHKQGCRLCSVSTRLQTADAVASLRTNEIGKN